MKTAFYPGTFDPVTYGHLDILSRAGHLFDKVIAGIALNEPKNPIFPQEERMALLKENVKDLPNIEVVAFDGLTVDFAKKHNAQAIIRGLRAISDFEYEFQMALMNRHLNNEIETILLMPSHEHFYTSANLIRSVANFSPERIARFVPENVLEALKKKFS